MPIKILHIFAPCYKERFTGPVVQWRYYFNHWNDNRVKHFILDTQTNQMIDARKAFDFQLTGEQKTNSRWERITWIPSLFRNLMKFRKDYDILHVHVLWWGGLFIGPWAKINKCPALYESVLLGADTPSGILKETLGRFKLWCLRTYTAILAISQHLADDYLDHGFSLTQVKLLMNSVDTELFHPADSDEKRNILRKELGIPIDSNVLIFVGSVIERKGMDILLRAFVESLKTTHDQNLLIVGAKNKSENPSIDEGFINNQLEMLETNGANERVHFLGLQQDRERLAEIYRVADVFVLPSRNEGLPSVLLEAMASGLAIITSKLPVLEKVIQSNENGIFIPVDDTNALINAINTLYNNPVHAKTLGVSARKYVEEKHSYLAWQSEIFKLYQSLVEQLGS